MPLGQPTCDRSSPRGHGTACAGQSRIHFGQAYAAALALEGELWQVSR